MKQFNYKRAWNELAKPAFEALPQNIRDLVANVNIEAKDLHQLSNLEMPWTEKSEVALSSDPALKQRFEKIPVEMLAEASHIVHMYGHWAYDEGKWIQENGTYWKFSNYADQVIREKLSVLHGKEPTGISYRIIDGFIRICISSNWNWQWEEVCVATKENFERIDKVEGRPRHPADNFYYRRSREEWDQFCDNAMIWVKKVKTQLVPKSGFIVDFFDLEKFMEDSNGC